jgi:hypothetical protein
VATTLVTPADRVQMFVVRFRTHQQRVKRAVHLLRALQVHLRVHLHICFYITPGLVSSPEARPGFSLINAVSAVASRSGA